MSEQTPRQRSRLKTHKLEKKMKIELFSLYIVFTHFWPSNGKKNQGTISFKRHPEPPHTSVCKIYERKKDKFSWEHHVVEHTSWKVPWKAELNV